MNTLNSLDFTKIVFLFRDLGEGKLLKKSLKKINSSKKIFIYYSKRGKVPICTLPKLRLILSSRTGFLSFCFNFYHFMYDNNIPIDINHTNIRYISDCVIAHEIGHILDPNIYKTRTSYTQLLTDLIDKLILYNIDICDKDLHKKNLPFDLEECALNLKKNLINRECDAWDIALNILDFESDDEKLLFYKIKEYALATYNFGNLSTIIKEHKLETYIKYIRTFCPSI